MGDSGGPLFVNITDSNSVIRQTLAGIVSGGYGCGLNVPGWYTKVSPLYLISGQVFSYLRRFPHSYLGSTASLRPAEIR